MTLGSPHHGSPTQNCVYSYDTPTSFMISLNEGDETPGGILNDAIGERNDTFLGVTYNGTHIPGNISYTSIYSSDDKIVTPYNTSYLEGARNILMQGLNHTELVTTQSGYEQVKEAVEDQAPITSTSTTSQTTTTTGTATSETSGVTLLASFLSLMVIHSIRRKKN